jgi:hypothetical protein
LKKALFILFILPLTIWAQTGTESNTDIDSLQLVIINAKHDSVIVKAWQAWDDIIYRSDPKLDFELNKKLICFVRKT